MEGLDAWESYERPIGSSEVAQLLPLAGRRSAQYETGLRKKVIHCVKEVTYFCKIIGGFCVSTVCNRGEVSTALRVKM